MEYATVLARLWRLDASEDALVKQLRDCGVKPSGIEWPPPVTNFVLNGPLLSDVTWHDMETTSQ